MTIRYDQVYRHFPVSGMGSVAERVLAVPRRGKVEAVFKRSIYCLFDNSYVCVGVDSLGIGPLNIISGIPWEQWRSLTYVKGMPVQVLPDGFRISRHYSFEFRDALVWAPHPPVALHPEKIEKGLKALEREALELVPDEGLGLYLFPQPVASRNQNPVISYAERSLIALGKWLQIMLLDPEKYRPPDPIKWQLLIGLGPGLTPSGDDLVGGVMLALKSLGEEEILRQLSMSTGELISERTHPISAAHLMAAMEGMGNEKLHAVMYAILSGKCSGYRDLLEDVSRIGHTSGWDALAGIVIVYRAWLKAQSPGNCSSFHGNNFREAAKTGDPINVADG